MASKSAIVAAFNRIHHLLKRKRGLLIARGKNRRESFDRACKKNLELGASRYTPGLVRRGLPITPAYIAMFYISEDSLKLLPVEYVPD